MRAAQLVVAGDRPRLEVREVPEPAPAPDQVVVAVAAAAFNHRDPWLWDDPATPVPVTLGSDGAGTIVAVGSGVTTARTGDEVVFDACLNWGDREDVPSERFDILGSPTPGTFADRVVVPAANLAPKPARLSWAEAATVNLAGLTAWRSVVTCARAGPGASLLVTGAGGGVATFALQIAVALGARVFVTTSTSGKLARAVGLGAAGGALYGDPDWPEQLVAQVGGPLDAAVDSFGAATWHQALRTLRRGGRLVSFGDTGGPTATIQVAEVYWQWRSIIGTSMGSPREYRAMLEHVERSDWRPVIDSEHPLDDVAAAARRLFAADRFGKVVLRP